MLLIVLVLLVGELVRFELEKRKVSKKRIELSKIKAEIYAENKRLQFEAYREYIENRNRNKRNSRRYILFRRSRCRSKFSKKLQFEAYREYIENKYRVVEEEVCAEVDETFQEITLVEGVQQLRDNGHKYVPYVRANPLHDIRSSLSEFTVDDVLRTFY